MNTLERSFFLILILLISISGFSQNQKTKKQPNENVKVNKEYDEDGNLIRYDSTYVYTWSSDSSMQFHPDSSIFFQPDFEMIKKQMQEHMNSFFKTDSISGNRFGYPFDLDEFFDDEFLGRRFFNHDSISNAPNSTNFFKDFDEMMKEHMKFRNEYMQKMHKNMDSLRQEFLKKNQEFYFKNDSITNKKRKDNKKGTVEL